MPKFSIIVPVYNVAPYLRECLDSVLAQTFTDWEAICVDDGSTDGSDAILDEYAVRDSRFRVVHQANAGVSAARNVGIDAAKGGWIVFVDGDDGLFAWSLTILESLIKNYPSTDIVMYSSDRTFELTSRSERIGIGYVRELLANDRAGARFLFAETAGSLLAWNGCYSQRIIDKVRFRHYSNCEDMLFGIEAIEHSDRIVKTSEKLYRYRIGRNDSAVNQKTLRHINSILAVIYEFTRLTGEWTYCEAVKDRLSEMIIGQVCTAFVIARTLAADARETGVEAIYNLLVRIGEEFPEILSKRMLKKISQIRKNSCEHDLYVRFLRPRQWAVRMSKIRGFNRFQRVLGKCFAGRLFG